MVTARESLIPYFPPMGVYETLFKFLDATGVYMGTDGTHPWAQGFPLTTQIPGGPSLPDSVSFTAQDLKYPQATGGIELLTAVRDYYNHFYGSNITTDNVAIFAGGRPGIFAAVAFMRPEVRILIEETEYTPYYDLLELLGRDYTVIPSNEGNNFRPTIADYEAEARGEVFVIKSNPCNPTGVTWTGDQLKSLVDFCGNDGRGGLIDEAYEFFHKPAPVSAMEYIEDIDKTNIFVVSAATKGLQVPGMRTGWIVASKQNIELFRNFSSIAMGGVARPSQIYVSKLMEIPRVTQAREAISSFYTMQRDRYRTALEELGFELFSGDGGFYHWGRLPGGLTADEFNERLFKDKAAILPGTLCDMHRRGSSGPMGDFIRFSFGPLKADSFEEDIEIIKRAL